MPEKQCSTAEELCDRNVDAISMQFINEMEEFPTIFHLSLRRFGSEGTVR
jgi:hypothetical protein